MSAEDRRAAIMERARADGIVRIAQLVADFRVSTMTIRRDLAVLAERGLIDKVHGAGVLRRTANDTPHASGDLTRDAAASEPAGTGGATRAHVGIVIPAGNYYFPLIAAGAREVFDARGVRRALAISNYDPGNEETLARQYIEAGSTGLLIAPSVDLDPAAADLERFAWLFEVPVPVVLLERTISSPARDVNLSSVRTDHDVGCEAATRHLARLGHRGVALVTHGGSQTAARVVAGWRRAVEFAGLELDRSPLIVNRRTNVQPFGESWPPSGAVGDVLDQLRAADVTAIIAHGDNVSLALVHGARGRGWRVPDDLSVITYDNELAEMGDPPLTAVAPPKQWVGRAAAELVLELAGDSAFPVRHLAIEPGLVVRDSTAAPRTASLP